MQSNQENMLQSAQKSWLWSDCKLVLRRTNPNNLSQESYQNLQAQVQLESDQIEQPFVPILRFKSFFSFDLNKGFYWKRGISLPTLNVKLQKSYFQLLQEDEQLIMIYCELTVAYPSRKDTHFYLEQIRTVGQKKKRFSTSGQAQFDGIILKQSSHQKSNSKFSLLVTICASSIEQNKIILKTLISTAFYTQNSRIKRKKIKKTKYVMKLVSPNAFLKPLSQVNIFDKQFTKERLINFLKNCNQNAKKLSIKHPLYMIYHFSGIFKVYFNSRQVKDLTQLLECIAPQKQAQSKLGNSKNAFVSYQLKKTKKIQKKIQIQTQIKKLRQKFTIKAKIEEGQALQKKLLMITFENDVLEVIQNTIQNEKQYGASSNFQHQLQSQINKLAKIFQKWTKIYLKVDLLKIQPWCICWKGVEKQNVYEAYKHHYYTTYDRLAGRQLQINQVQKEEDVY